MGERVSTGFEKMALEDENRGGPVREQRPVKKSPAAMMMTTTPTKLRAPRTTPALAVAGVLDAGAAGKLDGVGAVQPASVEPGGDVPPPGQGTHAGPVEGESRYVLAPHTQEERLVLPKGLVEPLGHAVHRPPLVDKA